MIDCLRFCKILVSKKKIKKKKTKKTIPSIPPLGLGPPLQVFPDSEGASQELPRLLGQWLARPEERRPQAPEEEFWESSS